MNQALSAILQNQIVVIARKVPEDQICRLAQALMEGGLSCLEVTFDHSHPGGIDESLNNLRRLNSEMGSAITLGAGTVLTAEEVRLAHQAGAKYIISPDTHPKVIQTTRSLGLVSIPGAMTPTEIRTAYDLGADIVKVFPASTLGPGFIRAMQGPFPHIPLLVAGGVTPENIGDYLKAGAKGAGCIGKLVHPEWMQAGHWSKITEVARNYVQAIDASKA